MRLCFMNLSGRLIDAFLALEEARRFSVAAERCHMSPSAFSQAIARLEQVVGVRLFDRDTRTVTLTAEGEVFAAGARRIAGEMQTAVDELKRRASLRAGRVAIAAPPSMASAWLPALLAVFRREHPAIALSLHDVVADRCLDLVLQGQVDFGLNAQQGNDLEFASHLLFHEHFLVLCRAGDPLAKRAKVSLRDLKGRDMIHTVRTGSVWQHLKPLLIDAQVRDSGFEVAQFGTVAGLVAAGFGISLVPESALPLCLREDLVAVPLSNRGAVRPLFMIRRRDRALSIAAENLWDRIVRDREEGQPPRIAP